MLQIEEAVANEDIKYPKEEGWKVVWVFNQSSCHKAMAADALDASKMNVNPGGKQLNTHDTVWAGRHRRCHLTLEYQRV